MGVVCILHSKGFCLAMEFRVATRIKLVFCYVALWVTHASSLALDSAW